jgi:hypothetical protein
MSNIKIGELEQLAYCNKTVRHYCAMKWMGKHVPAVMDMYMRIEELLGR